MAILMTAKEFIEQVKITAGGTLPSTANGVMYIAFTI